MADNDKKGFEYSRAQLKVLVVTPSGTLSNQIRGALKTLGISEISAAPSHLDGYERQKMRNFTHVLFEAQGTDMPSLEFVEKTIELDPNVLMVTLSEEPRIDDVFSLLRAGARHFLCVPFTIETLEDVLRTASDGSPVSDAVLNAPDRNNALVGVILNNLYKLATSMRQAREFPTAAREVSLNEEKLIISVDMARLFCEGADEDLQEEIVSSCIARANVAATRLGRTRARLRNKRVKEDDGATA